MKIKVYVTLKKGVLDPQGQAVQKTLARTGFEAIVWITPDAISPDSVSSGSPAARAASNNSRKRPNCARCRAR